MPYLPAINYPPRGYGRPFKRSTRFGAHIYGKKGAATTIQRFARGFIDRVATKKYKKNPQWFQKRDFARSTSKILKMFRNKYK